MPADAPTVSRKPSATRNPAMPTASPGTMPAAPANWSRDLLVVSHLPEPAPTLRAVRAERTEEEGFPVDRTVFEFDGALPGYAVRFVPAVYPPFQGPRLALRGHAFIEVTFFPVAACLGPPHSRSPLSALGSATATTECRLAGDFEGYLHFGLGVETAGSFRVVEVPESSSLVLDVRAWGACLPVRSSADDNL